MTLAKYKRALKAASALPEDLLDLEVNPFYSPREAAINFVVKKARLDVDNLFDFELEELLADARIAVDQ